MSEQVPQNFKKHARLDPPYHLVTFLTLIVSLIVAVVYLIGHPHFFTAWLVVISVVVFIPFFKIRTYALKVQDRVIRLEERLRLQALAPAEWHPQIAKLTEDQLIALRFAPDDELVPLAKQALEENLSRKQIKERIKNWRADHWRV
ncbi:MAG TPA: DUF6526 family protein [Terracidiphilus sp.]|jgi:hypothetical protein|nr:DUF6526 family protein [Terracidiphilus sp.]